ncbi:MAG: replicative DNA helicase [Proteobacteria bacterium]|nr:replicative DNA helicase [Pseudomonadota bacterium]
MNSIPPQNIEAEQAVLGTMLLDDRSLPIVMSILCADDFYRPDHKEIFSTISSLFSENKNVDIVTVKNGMKIGNDAVAYLAELTGIVPSTSRVESYCLIVKERSKARDMIRLSQDVISRCYNLEPVKKITDSFGSEFFALAVDDKKSATLISDSIDSTLAVIKARQDSDRHISGLETGFYDLDKRLSGLCKKKLYIVAGRPSMGKSALAMNILESVSMQGETGMFFSLEMGKEELIERMLSSMSGVNGNAIRGGFLNNTTWPKVTHSAGKAKGMKLLIDETPALSIVELRARAKMAAARYGIGLIVVDYLQLMTAKAETRTLEIAKITGGLKGLSKELDIPIIALSQLNRSLENRTEKRPMMSDLRESGAIEQDADVIIFVYRDEVYNKSNDNPEKGVAELIISKQRGGPTGTVKLAFRGELTRFENLIGESGMDQNAGA